ncbi:MAG: hypothetical protein WAX69_13905 [Victivallales bacterium]
MQRLLISVMAVSALILSATGEDKPMPQAADAKTSLVVNGGFEEWVDASKLNPGVLDRREVKAVSMVEPLYPLNWLQAAEAYEKDARLTVSVGRDSEVRHSGLYSLRIKNDSPTDIGVMYYNPDVFAGANERLSVKPNRRYEFSWWVKGDNVQPGDGSGTILMTKVYSVKDGKESASPAYYQGKAPKGTFDWQKLTFTLTTDEYARSIVFSIQNRRAKGTLWYDDVEMHDMGPVVNAETY